MVLENQELRFDDASLARLEATLCDSSSHCGIELSKVGQGLAAGRVWSPGPGSTTSLSLRVPRVCRAVLLPRVPCVVRTQPGRLTLQVHCLTFNNMSDAMFEPANWQRFVRFVGRLRERAEKAAVVSQSERELELQAEREETAPCVGRPVFA